MSKIRILIADDHAMLRDGLRALFEGQADMEVVGEVGDAPSVAPAAAETKADVILLDITMPGGGGLTSIPDILRSRREARIVMLTMHESQRYLRRAMEMGASGYVPKRLAGTQILEAVRRAHAGETTGEMHLEGSAAVARPGFRRTGPRTTADLSPREREVLEMVASGLTNRETAERLGVSIKTVEGYRARLMRKIGATSRADLVRHAINLGLLEVHAGAAAAASAS
jgi:DNA-binding NarL/FixJ family response regulator